MNAQMQFSLNELLKESALNEALQYADQMARILATPAKHGLGKDDLRYLHGPIVLYRAGWDFPTMLRKLVPTARLELVLSGEKNLCTFEEALGYLSTLSLAGPLDHEIAEIFFWLSQEVLSKHKIADDVYSMLGFKKPVTLSDYQERHLLHQLRADIRRSVVKNAKGKGI